MTMETKLIVGTCYVLLAPVLMGLLLALLDKGSARLEGRRGVPLLQPFYDSMKLFQKHRPEKTVDKGEEAVRKGAVCALAAAGVILITGGSLTSCALLFCAAELLLKQRMSAAGGIALFAIAAGMFSAFEGDEIGLLIENGIWEEKGVIGPLSVGFVITAALLVLAFVEIRNPSGVSRGESGSTLAWRRLAESYGLTFLMTLLYLCARSGIVGNAGGAAAFSVATFYAAALAAPCFGRPGREKTSLTIGAVLLATLAFHLMVLSFRGVL